ncbi:MAG: DUF72 domain-containing protein, partial [Desulfonatronovibrio sp.]
IHVMRNYTGCSGYNYKNWQGKFYPRDLPRKKWLEYYAGKFDTVEINNSFYRLPEEKTLKSWYDQVPGNFRFTLKGSRYVTHLKKLNQTGEAVKKFYDRAGLLKGKLGCILWQLPGNQHKDTEKLEKFCRTLSRDFRNVMEFRHNSWYDEEVYEVMKSYGVIFCVISAPDGLSDEAVKTAGHVYMRFHGRNSWYRDQYSTKELRGWSQKLQRLKPKQIYAYFNNDYQAYAPENAREFQEMIG